MTRFLEPCFWTFDLLSSSTILYSTAGIPGCSWDDRLQRPTFPCLDCIHVRFQNSCRFSNKKSNLKCRGLQTAMELVSLALFAVCSTVSAGVRWDITVPNYSCFAWSHAWTCMFTCVHCIHFTFLCWLHGPEKSTGFTRGLALRIQLILKWSRIWRVFKVKNRVVL